MGCRPRQVEISSGPGAAGACKRYDPYLRRYPQLRIYSVDLQGKLASILSNEDALALFRTGHAQMRGGSGDVSILSENGSYKPTAVSSEPLLLLVLCGLSCWLPLVGALKGGGALLVVAAKAGGGLVARAAELLAAAVDEEGRRLVVSQMMTSRGAVSSTCPPEKMLFQ